MLQSRKLYRKSDLLVILFALVSIGIFVIFTLLANSVCRKWYGLLVGIPLMLLAIPFHVLGNEKKIGYLISFLLNSVGNGFSASAYYLQRNVSVNLTSALMAAIPACGVLLLAFLLLQIFWKKKVAIITAVVIESMLLAAAVVFWIIWDAGFFSFGFFCLLIALFYLCVLAFLLKKNDSVVLQNISFGSFGAFLALTIVVLIILSEGEILDGIDLDLRGTGKRKRR